jgi:hypothetical protein
MCNKDDSLSAVHCVGGRYMVHIRQCESIKILHADIEDRHRGEQITLGEQIILVSIRRTSHYTTHSHKKRDSRVQQLMGQDKIKTIKITFCLSK